MCKQQCPYALLIIMLQLFRYVMFWVSVNLPTLSHRPSSYFFCSSVDMDGINSLNRLGIAQIHGSLDYHLSCPFAIDTQRIFQWDLGSAFL